MSIWVKRGIDLESQLATSVTLVIPCLNEAGSIRALLSECRNYLETCGLSSQWKIIVADNGSTDGSDEIARGLGVEVVRVAKRGYGAAVHGGMEYASSPWTVYFDGDGTYRIEDAVRLVSEAIRQDADLAIGSRFLGDIERGAMPWHHQLIGTPIMSGLLSLILGFRVSDCNSGLRCVKTASYRSWGVTARGMEFASEMVIKAALSKSKVIEFPVVLRNAPAERDSHLCWWRDGLRHLHVMLKAVGSRSHGIF
jgi:glycosyltransferase involved in cell wall biosynthesis